MHKEYHRAPRLVLVLSQSYRPSLIVIHWSIQNAAVDDAT